MRFIWIVLAGLAQSGCQMAAAAPGQDSPHVLRPAPVTPQREEPAPMPKTPEPTDAGSRALIDKARNDLMKRLKRPADEVRFVSFEAVTWPNGALGCPRPGAGYTQVPREGYLIRFEVQGRQYSYHGGAGRDPFLCPNPETGAQPEIPRASGPGERI